jgi:HEAT repeat protein
MTSAGDRQCIDMIKEIIDIKERDVRRMMAEVLALHCDLEDLPFILGQMDAYADPVVMKSMLFAVSRLRAAEATQNVLALLKHKVPEVREAALETAIALGTPEVFAHFQSEAGDHDPEIKARAIYALGRLDPEANEGHIITALSDADAKVRMSAMDSLAQLPVTPERLALFRPLLDDPDRSVRQTLVQVIGNCPPEDCLDMLLKTLHDDDDWVLLRTIEALARTKSPDVALKLMEKFEGSSRMVQMKIIEAFGEIGGSVAFQALLNLMDTDDPEIQEAADTAASRIRDEHGEPA